jgi:hypothetical protein
MNLGKKRQLDGFYAHTAEILLISEESLAHVKYGNRYSINNLQYVPVGTIKVFNLATANAIFFRLSLQLLRHGLIMLIALLEIHACHWQIGL